MTLNIEMDDVEESERTRSFIRYLLMMTEYHEAAKTVDKHEKSEEKKYIDNIEREMFLGKKLEISKNVGDLEYEMIKRTKNVVGEEIKGEDMGNREDLQSFYNDVAKQRMEEKIKQDEEQMKRLTVDRRDSKIPSIGLDVSAARKEKNVEENNEIDNLLAEVIFKDTLNGREYLRWDSIKLGEVLKNLPGDIQKDLVMRMEKRLYELGLTPGDIKGD